MLQICGSIEEISEMGGKNGSAADKADLIHDFLASANVFAAAVGEEIEQALLRRTGGAAVTVAQLKLLKLVSVAEAQTIGGVAAFLGVSNAAASKAVDRLVRRKLMARRERETDRRFIHLVLTEEGRRLLESYEDARRKKLIELFGDFPEEELRRVADLLDRMALRVVENTAGAREVCFQCGIYFRKDCLMRRLRGRSCLYVQRNSWAAEAHPV